MADLVADHDFWFEYTGDGDYEALDTTYFTPMINHSKQLIVHLATGYSEQKS